MRPRPSAVAAVVASCAFAACGARSPLTLVLHPPPIDPAISRACLMFYSCSGWQGLLQPERQGVSECIASSGTSALGGPPFVATGLFQDTPASCLAAARSCQDVAACVYGNADACFDPPSTSFCRNGFAVHCLGSLASTGDDCASGGFLRDPGATCMQDSSGSAVCGFGKCDPQTATSCDGQTQLDCITGVVGRFTCPPGTVCVAASAALPHSSGIACTGTGPACSADRCDGDDAVSCINGFEWRHACGVATSGFVTACAVSASGVASCVPAPELACDPGQYVDHCDGPNLVYCDGDERIADCRSLGFASCGAESGGWAGCR